MDSDRSHIVFFPEGAYGPTNNCVGIAEVLRRDGHRVTFVVEESFAGTLQAKGFEEALMRLTPKSEVDEEPGQFWRDFIRDTAPHFREDTLQQLETLIKPIWEGLIDGSMYVNERLAQIFSELQPDVIVEDNVVAFPALLTADVPWVRMLSCNPLEAKDPDLPPPFSGLPLVDRTRWDSFRRRYRELHFELHDRFSSWAQEQGCPPLPQDEFMYTSPYLNLYLYPAEADYPRSRPLGETWHRLDSCVRATEEPFEIPDRLQGRDALLYVSLGSLGSADIELMQRLIDLLSATNYGVIISMGPQQGQLPLPDNMTGAELLPQPSILPLVDLVITHGGNNTVTECFHFGKPMVALPLFWDQHDNAQRIDEAGFGKRLAPFAFTDDEFYGAISTLLADAALHDRLQRIANRLQSDPGTARAADLIERVALRSLPAVTPLTP